MKKDEVLRLIKLKLPSFNREIKIKSVKPMEAVIKYKNNILIANNLYKNCTLLIKYKDYLIYQCNQTNKFLLINKNEFTKDKDLKLLYMLFYIAKKIDYDISKISLEYINKLGLLKIRKLYYLNKQNNYREESLKISEEVNKFNPLIKIESVLSGKLINSSIDMFLYPTLSDKNGLDNNHFTILNDILFKYPYYYNELINKEIIFININESQIKENDIIKYNFKLNIDNIQIEYELINNQ